MHKSLRLLSLAGVLAIASLPASAAVILEAETNGTASNNSIATAQALMPSSFTTAPANVFAPVSSRTVTIHGRTGGDDVDYYFFDINYTGAWLYLDVDNSPATFDSIVAVFNPAGTLIAYGDDSNSLDAGSASTIDSLVGPLALTQTGRYYIAIAEFPNYPSAALLASETALSLGGRQVTGAAAGISTFDFNGVQGTDALTYNLNATVAAPEPTTFGLVGAALVAIGFKLRKRK